VRWNFISVNSRSSAVKMSAELQEILHAVRGELKDLLQWTHFVISEAMRRKCPACFDYAPRSFLRRNRALSRKFGCHQKFDAVRQISFRSRIPGNRHRSGEIREIRVSPLSVFIRVHPWLKKKLCGSLRSLRLGVEKIASGESPDTAGESKIFAAPMGNVIHSRVTPHRTGLALGVRLNPNE
jgi:hypothetical protein